MSTASAHEDRLAAEGRRRGLGAWYTPADVVNGLLRLTLDPLLAERSAQGVDAVRAVRVVDPSCGSGNVLVAAAARIATALVDLGEAPADAAEAARGCVAGVDIDPDAVGACRLALGGTDRVLAADALALQAARWRSLAPHGFDLVVGNPPFLGQLRSSTARGAGSASALRARFGAVVGPYTDPAALFVVLGLELARPDGGVVALLQPLPVLAARDAGAVRARVRERADLVHLWVAAERIFDAEVDVCGPVLVRGGRRRRSTEVVRTAVSVGRSFAPAGTVDQPSPGPGSWSPLLAAALDLPVRAVAGVGRVGDLATATADFRDQYYGLAPHVEEAAGGAAPTRERPALATVGVIDPAHLAWGERALRFNKATYRRPVVRCGDLEPKLQAWARDRLVPKVLVATQTRVLEAVVDRTGVVLPSVPVITVVPHTDDAGSLDRLGALLTSPPITLLASQRHLGAGRNRHALKLRAAEVLDLPLPVDEAAWQDGAAHFLAASLAPGTAARLDALVACGQAMNRAFGLGDDPELLDWWVGRLPVSGARTPGPGLPATRR